MSSSTKSPVFSSPAYWLALGAGVVGIGAAAMQERRSGSKSENESWTLIFFEHSFELDKWGDAKRDRNGRPKMKITGAYVQDTVYLSENPDEQEIFNELGAYGDPSRMVLKSKTRDVIEVGHKDQPGSRIARPFARLERDLPEDPYRNFGTPVDLKSLGY